MSAYKVRIGQIAHSLQQPFHRRGLAIFLTRHQLSREKPQDSAALTGLNTQCSRRLTGQLVPWVSAHGLKSSSHIRFRWGAHRGRYENRMNNQHMAPCVSTQWFNSFSHIEFRRWAAEGDSQDHSLSRMTYRDYCLRHVKGSIEFRQIRRTLTASPLFIAKIPKLARWKRCRGRDGETLWLKKPASSKSEY